MIPSTDELLLPVLRALGDGDRHRNLEIYKALQEQYGVTPAERRQQTDTGSQELFDNRYGWALSLLEAAGLLERPAQGQLRLTKPGQSVVAERQSLTEDDLTGFPAFNAWLNRPVSHTRAEQASLEKSPVWLVGAMIGNLDRTQGFVSEGTWLTSDPSPRDRELLARMREGDRIAIKSTFTQKHDLPFANQGKAVSVCRIKARGRVVRVDGATLLVDWEPGFEPRDWYFYTGRRTIWRLTNAPMAQLLKRFIFDDEEQDLDLFLADPYWAGRYNPTDAGPAAEADPGVPDSEWVPFYEAFADNLLEESDMPGRLPTLLEEANRERTTGTWADRYSEDADEVGTSHPIALMATFNQRGMTDDERAATATRLATATGLDFEVPARFAGAPTVASMPTTDDKQSSMVWDAMRTLVALTLEGNASDAVAKEAKNAITTGLQALGWDFTVGLHWARPNHFMPVYEVTRHLTGQPPEPDVDEAASWYLALLGDTFPEEGGFSAQVAQAMTEHPEAAEHAPEASGYSVHDLMNDGCFLPKNEVEKLVALLRRHKNVILQGAPGTGKTWLAKRLGWVLADERSSQDVSVVQFHPNTSYEDFVRGYRPATNKEGAAGLKLVDGPYLRMAAAALRNTQKNHTMVIEEINRGNPARALGELLTLIEASKRTAADAIRLTYERPEVDKGGVWLPPNLHTIGTMNVADRSLALVDFALRRRFKFVTLAPQFNSQWEQWVKDRSGGESAAALVTAVKQGMAELNSAIAAEPSLGENFVIGHSFMTPDETVDDAESWFVEQIETAIRPLLHEYWFDNHTVADQHTDKLLAAVKNHA